MYWQLKCVSIKISSCNESTLIIMTTYGGCQGLLKEENGETSQDVQWLGLCASITRGTVLIPSWGTKILQASRPKKSINIYNFFLMKKMTWGTDLQYQILRLFLNTSKLAFQ